MLGGIVIACVISTIWIAGQIILRRATRSESHFKSMLIGYIASFALIYLFWSCFPAVFPAGWTVLVRDEDPAHALLHAYFANTLIFLLYVECFYHVERSVTLRLMIEILVHPSRNPTIDEISKNYRLDDMIAERLAVLVANGYVKRSGNRFLLLTKGRRLASAVRLFCWIFQSKTQDERV